MDELAPLRDEFLIPPTVAGASYRTAGSPCLYFCGNSLGLQPKAARGFIEAEMSKWEHHAVEGHFTEPKPWVTVDELAPASLARIVGALPSEVVAMNTLSANLHFLMVPFYRPTPTRFKILIEAKSFPSDYFAVESQIRFHGFDPAEALIEVSPRPGEVCLRAEDIDDLIVKHGPQLALVMFSGVQYYTGQHFDLPRIVRSGHAVGAVVGFDLAHAVGNVVLNLHDWDVDFAVWCTYKYLNSGPGCVGGAFVHERHGSDPTLPRFAGWWGTNKHNRFNMAHSFELTPGAFGFQVSNPGVLQIASLMASMSVFDKTSLTDMRTKSVALTRYLEVLLTSALAGRGEIITPADPDQRGCQLSVLFPFNVSALWEALNKESVVVDVRKPDVIRVSPTPLYNTFSDVCEFVAVLTKVLDALASSPSP